MSVFEKAKKIFKRKFFIQHLQVLKISLASYARNMRGE